MADITGVDLATLVRHKMGEFTDLSEDLPRSPPDLYFLTPPIAGAFIHS